MAVKTFIVIPARYGSERLKNKLMLEIGGVPILAHTIKSALKCVNIDKVIVAVDNQVLFDCASRLPCDVVMTPDSCTSGTERIAYVVNQMDECPDIWVNWQADEPFANPMYVESLVNSLTCSEHLVATIASRFESEEDWLSKHNVKVVRSSSGAAMYFSRAPIPAMKDHDWSGAKKNVYHHIGMYAYRHNFWKLYNNMSKSDIAHAESLEQLTWLYHGLSIDVRIVEGSPHGVDTHTDYHKLKAFVE